ncbi:MAG: ATP-dependent DNA ligase LigA [Haloarculaceae archaeon]
MDFAAFARYVADIESESADHDVRDRAVDLLAAAGPDLRVVARYVQGRVFPVHDSTKLDVGPTLCYEAIAKAAGQNVDAADVEDRVADVGDVGEVAASYDFGSQRGLGAFGGGATGDAGPDPDGDSDLTVTAVDDRLREVAAAEGSGSTDRKRDLLFDLFNRADPDEARYLARLVLGEMRVGVGEGTVRDAIAGAFDVPVETVERALQVTNDYGEVAVVARDDGAPGLDALGLEVGRPVDPMLAQAGTVTEALDDWDEAAVERKYDGARVQVHYDGESVALFSRNMEDVTGALPEVVGFVESALDRPAILDGEVVAVDDDGSPLPFQEVLRRFRRKHDVARAREDVAVELHAFDCLHVGGRESAPDPGGGEDLLDAPLVERHDRLATLLDGEGDAVSDPVVTDDPDEIAAVEERALDAGHEGVMLKNPESTYTPGRRGKNWLKRKPDVETLDLVVTGAEWGEGRRANLLGTFLLSVRTSDGFATIGKVATGITDEELEALTDRLEPHVRDQDGTEVDVEPAVVFEVGYEEIQASPTYSSGYALRFPRFVGVREDKDPDGADSLERVERLAESQ